MRDYSERPALPYGLPAPNAALLEALDDLIRLNAAQAAIHKSGLAERDGDRVPGYSDLEDARDVTLDRLARERTESLTGF